MTADGLTGVAIGYGYTGSTDNPQESASRDFQEVGVLYGFFGPPEGGV